jgi:hypothetical protein
MIILFSILLLVFLVYLGIKREGMTTNVGGQLIDALGTYYATKTTNEAATPPIDNTRNAQTTINIIKKLNITDEPYASIITNTDIDNESKLNMIKTALSNNLSQKNAQPSMTLNNYRGILSILQDASSKPEQKVSEVKQIVYVNSQDPRFGYIFDGTAVYGDDAARVEAIQTAAYNTLNPV